MRGRAAAGNDALRYFILVQESLNPANLCVLSVSAFVGHASRITHHASRNTQHAPSLCQRDWLNHTRDAHLRIRLSQVPPDLQLPFEARESGSPANVPKVRQQK